MKLVDNFSKGLNPELFKPSPKTGVPVCRDRRQVNEDLTLLNMMGLEPSMLTGPKHNLTAALLKEMGEFISTQNLKGTT
jgi:hypothetical protein